jgi:GNAT superfamily N-acetyltransferase
LCYTQKEVNMKIVDLSEKYLDSYCVCLEDWSDEMKETGDHKRCWYNETKEKGLGVKLAINDKEEAVGMIQYLPVEHSYAMGKDLYAILCIWVHGYKEGTGNHQKKGIGKALLAAAEEEVRAKGACGMAAWGLSLPFWMKASWFRKQGYSKVDQVGFLGPVLVWKPFVEGAEPPRWVRQQKKPEKEPGKVTVTGFIQGWCPAQNLAFERAKRAAREYGDKVTFREIHTSNRKVFMEWGLGDALFIDQKRVRTGPPPSFEKLKKKIDREVNRLQEQ